MTLYQKTFLIIAVTLAGLMAFLYVISRVTLLNSFIDLEERNTRQAVEQALNALSDDLTGLNSTVRDWAAWDDTYEFMTGHNPDYMAFNLDDGVFVNLQLNLVLFVDARDQIVAGKAFDLQNEVEIPLPPGLPEHLATHDFLLRHPDADSSIAGIVLLPEGPLLLASQPILTSNYEGPIPGTLIMGRYLDQAKVESLAAVTRLPLAIYPFGQPPSPELQAALACLANADQSCVRPLNEETVAGYGQVNDIYGQPALVVQVELPRRIYRQGQASLSFFMGLLLAVGTGFSLMSLLLLGKLVLSPLSRLSANVRQVGASADLAARIPVTGRDEIAGLAAAINRTLAELEQAQRELRTSEAHNQALLDAMPDFMCRLNQEGVCLQFKAPRDKTLLEPAVARQLVGLPLHTFLPPELAPLATHTIHQVLQTGEIQVVEYQMPVNGASLTFEARTVGCGPDEVLTIVRDITERKKAEIELALARDEAMEASRLKSQLLANVSHDLRTPLNAILGYTEMLQEGFYGPLSERQQKILQEITGSTEQLLSLINNLLDQAQLESGQIVLARLAFSPEELLEAVQATTRMLASAKGLSLAWEISPDVPRPLWGSPYWLQRILVNLVSNAIKFTEQGTVHVQVFRHDEGHWAVQVTDTGVGIPAEAQAYIFEPFRQVDGTTTRKRSGSGLGLSIVRELTHRMGGHINLVSEVGRGSNFIVILPLNSVQEEADENGTGVDH